MKRKTKPNLYVTKHCNLQEHLLFDFNNECKNTQRYDVLKYEFLDELNDKMLSFFWRPQEISLVRDKADYEVNTDFYERFILTEQLKKLVMLDSLQGRGPVLTFGQLTTNPEFESIVDTWQFFENIHSRSYSWLIQSVYPDPQKVFDETFDNKLLMKHTKTIIKDYNELYPLILKYNDLQKVDMYDMKKKILKAMVSIGILEGIRFYSGFASVWALTEFRGIFDGSSNILKLIARDENVHMTLTQHVINKLRRNEEEGFTKVFEELTPWIYDMYFQASEEEFEWIDYLYQHGCPLGINQNIGKEYIKYLTNLRLRAIGLKSIYPGSTKNPISWINKWLNTSSSEIALQEKESGDYQSGGIIMEDVNFKKIYHEI